MAFSEMRGLFVAMNWGGVQIKLALASYLVEGGWHLTPLLPPRCCLSAPAIVAMLAILFDALPPSIVCSVFRISSGEEEKKHDC